MTIKLALIQMKVSPQKQVNLQIVDQYLQKTCKSDIQLALLPEMFCCPYHASLFPSYAEIEGGEIYQGLSRLAQKYKIYLCAGSMPEKDENEKIYNTAYVFDPQGQCVAKHRKVHLFDVDVKGGQYFKESDTLSPGNLFTVFNTPYGKIGLCICYDFRFPELARLMALEGAELILVPGAFNLTTGPAHWELLFRQRAVDNQLYTAGCAPAQDLEASYTSWGHSIVVSPWGKVLQSLDEKEGFFIQEIDLSLNKKIREQLPLLHHLRKDLYHLEYTGK